MSSFFIQGALIGHLTALIITLWIGLGSYINKVVVTPPSPITTAGCRHLNFTTTMTPTTNMTTQAVVPTEM